MFSVSGATTNFEGFANFADTVSEVIVNFEVFVYFFTQSWDDIIEMTASQDDFGGAIMVFFAKKFKLFYHHLLA